MKFILFIFLFQIFLCISCQKHDKEYNVISHAEDLIKPHPDSAYLLLNSIMTPDRLNDKLFAHWCMLSGKVASDLHKDMPYTSFLLRAQSWYERYGTAKERAELGLYLGRSYVEEKNYDEAMTIFVKALDVARKAKEYNLAGYMCSFMADLYGLKDIPDQSKIKYQEGADYFLRANNNRSYVLALRDVSFAFCLQDSLNLALLSLKKADSIASILNDSVVLSSVANAMGNVYAMIDSFDNAEKYLLKSLDFDSNEVAPNYLGLSKLCMNNGDLKKSQYYLEKSKIETENNYTSVGIIFQHYLLEKAMSKPVEALSYLELYCQVSDSILISQNDIRIVEVEKKYEHVKLLNENSKLRINRLYSLIMLVIAVVGCLLLAFLYQIKSKRDDREMYEQQKILDNKEKKLLQFIVDMDEKEEELRELKNLLVQNEKQEDIQKLLNEHELIYQKQKEEIEKTKNEVNLLKNKMLFSFPIVKKITKLSQIVVPGATQSPLTLKDWHMLMGKIDDIYFLFNEKLLKRGIKEDSVEMQYCNLSLLLLDKTQEAIILHINPDSIYKLRFRVRQKLQISGEKGSIYQYLITM